MASYLKVACELLSSNHPTVAAVIGDSDPYRLVLDSDDLGIFQPLLSALEEAAEVKEAEAAEIMPDRVGGYSGRMRAPLEAKEAKIRGEARELSLAATNLEASLSVLVGARHQVEALSDDSVETGGQKGGVLTAVMKSSLQVYNISMQRYWNGTLVGPDVRIFLAVYMHILKVIADEMSKIHGQVEADRFLQRFSSVFVHLATISHLSRTTREKVDRYGRLTATEIGELEIACIGFGAAFRLAHKRMLTVKGHIVEQHLVSVARRFGNIGIMGEDGIEALHCLDSRARLITRTMRNAKQRNMAIARHSNLAKHGRGEDRPKRKRRASSPAAAAATATDSESEPETEHELQHAVLSRVVGVNVLMGEI